MNTVIQGSAADVIKQAMVLVDTAMMHTGRSSSMSSSSSSSSSNIRPLPGRMLLQIHDELVFEVGEADVRELVEGVEHIMTVEVPKRIEQLCNQWLFSPLDAIIGKNRERNTFASSSSSSSSASSFTSFAPPSVDTRTETYLRDCATLLGHTPKLQVPLKVNMEAGKTWGTLSKV